MKKIPIPHFQSWCFVNEYLFMGIVWKRKTCRILWCNSHWMILISIYESKRYFWETVFSSISHSKFADVSRPLRKNNATEYISKIKVYLCYLDCRTPSSVPFTFVIWVTSSIVFMTIDFKVKKEAKILLIRWLHTHSKEVHTVDNQ